MAEFDPYHEWLGISPKDQPPHAYRLLGLERFEANPRVIEAAAEQRTLLLRSRASGPQGEATQKLLNEVQRARILLLDDAKRAAYDAELRATSGAGDAAIASPLVGGPVVTIVKDAEGVRRPAPSPGVPLAGIVAAAVAGLVVLGGLVYWFTSGPAKDPAPVVRQTVPPPVAPPQPPRPAPAIEPVKPPIDTPLPMPVPPVDPPSPPEKVEPMPPIDPPADPPPAIEPRPPVDPAPATDPPEPPAAPEADTRHPKPLPAEQEKPLASFREIFKTELAKTKKAEEWQAVVAKVLEVAGESEADPATQYVLLEQARQLAAKAGLWEASESAIAALAARYQVDETALRLESLATALESPAGPASRKQAVSAAFEIFDDLLAREQVDQAAQLARSLADPVRETRDKELIQQLAARKKRGGELFGVLKRLTAARAAVKAKPEDAEARLELGKSLVLRGAWAEATPHLALGSDPGWKAVAAKEAPLPTASDAQVAAADAWWDISERAEADLKLPLQRRAAAWYQTALPQLTGIAKAKAERRLAALPPEALANLEDPLATAVVSSEQPHVRPTGKLIKEIYLDELDEDYSRLFFGPLGRLGSFQERELGVMPCVIDGKRVPHALQVATYVDGARNSNALVQYDIGQAFTTFSGAVGFNNAPGQGNPGSPVVFTIFGDGKRLWQSAPVRGKGQEQEFSIKVSGIRQLRLEARSEGSAAYAHCVWIMPKLSGGMKPLATLADRLAAPRPVYLDDLAAYDWHSGHGSLGCLGATSYDRNEAPFFTLQERRVFHAVGMYPKAKPAYACYRLAGRYRSLKTVASLQAAPPGVPPFEGRLLFRAIGDGKLLWESKPLTQHGQSQPATIDLTGVENLELAVGCQGKSDFAWCAWLEPILEPARRSPPPEGLITADEIVLWNTSNSTALDWGTGRVNLLFFAGDDLVHQQIGVRVPWARGAPMSVRVPASKRPFNRLRVEVIDVIHRGGGLDEVEVIQGGTNVALRAIATSSESNDWWEGNGLFAPFMANDGIRDVSQGSHGYWMLQDHNCGWLELEWRKPNPAAKAHPTLGYPLAKHPATAIPFGGHWYLPFPGRITWDEAQRRCQAMGGYLVCIETEAEARWADALARRQVVWCGGRRDAGGTWRWINGKDVTYTNWVAGQPDNAGGVENLLELWGGRGWNDTGPDRAGNRGYICEWEE